MSNKEEEVKRIIAVFKEYSIELDPSAQHWLELANSILALIDVDKMARERGKKPTVHLKYDPRVDGHEYRHG